MQFSQPNFQLPGFNHCGQPAGFHAPIPPVPNFNGYPELIGEGNVISFTCPDGSTQLVFLPTVQWPQCRTLYMPGPQCPYIGSPLTNLSGAWLVRSIFNQVQPQPTMFCQPFQDYFGIQYARPPALDCCGNLHPTVCMSQSGLPLKFHNDNCTSTSDLHFFIPKQCTWFRTVSGSIGVQVQVPTVANAACNYETINACPPNKTTADEVKCMCSKESNSRMSVDSTKSKQRRKEKSHKSKRWSNSGSDMSIDSTKSSHKCKAKVRKQKRTQHKKSNHTCECREPQADKAIVTYTDQGNYCAPDTGQETQTEVNQTSSFACNCSSASKGSKESRILKATLPKASCSKKVCESLSWDSIVSDRRKNTSDLGTCTCTSGSELTDY